MSPHLWPPEDDNAIRNILQQANVAAKDIGLDIVNEQELNVSKSKGQDPAPEKYFQLQSIKGGLDYTIISLGHEVGVKTRYKKTDLKKYEIKIRKGRDSAMKRECAIPINLEKVLIKKGAYVVGYLNMTSST
jgi:hypothetical protein